MVIDKFKIYKKFKITNPTLDP